MWQEKTLQHSLGVTHLGCRITSSDSEDLCWETSCKSGSGSIPWIIPLDDPYNSFCGVADNQRVAPLRICCFWTAPNYSVNFNELACQFQYPFPVIQNWIKEWPHTFLYYCIKCASQYFQNIEGFLGVGIFLCILMLCTILLWTAQRSYLNDLIDCTSSSQKQKHSKK